MTNSKVVDVADALWKEKSEDRWREFAEALKGSGVRYYKVVFADEGKLTRMQDLTKSYAQLYDADYKTVTKVPLFMKQGKGIRGATKYLIGLQVSNKASE